MKRFWALTLITSLLVLPSHASHNSVFKGMSKSTYDWTQELCYSYISLGKVSVSYGRAYYVWRGLLDTLSFGYSDRFFDEKLKAEILIQDPEYFKALEDCFGEKNEKDILKFTQKLIYSPLAGTALGMMSLTKIVKVGGTWFSTLSPKAKSTLKLADLSFNTAMWSMVASDLALMAYNKYLSSKFSPYYAKDQSVVEQTIDNTGTLADLKSLIGLFNDERNELFAFLENTRDEESQRMIEQKIKKTDEKIALAKTLMVEIKSRKP